MFGNQVTTAFIFLKPHRYLPTTQCKVNSVFVKSRTQISNRGRNSIRYLGVQDQFFSGKDAWHRMAIQPSRSWGLGSSSRGGSGTKLNFYSALWKQSLLKSFFCKKKNFSLQAGKKKIFFSKIFFSIWLYNVCFSRI